MPQIDARIRPRSEWNGRPPDYRYFMELPKSELWLHHTAGSQDKGGNGWYDDDLRDVQDYHMDVKNWSDIAYSWLADSKGQSWEGRGAGVVGGHTAGRNSKSHAICAIGNYELYRPTPELLEAIAWQTAHGWFAGWHDGRIDGPHRDAPGASTACCGKFLIAEIPRINERAGQIIVEVFDAINNKQPLPPASVPAPPKETMTLDVRVPLRRGDKGGDVGTLQSLLNGKGGASITVDRDFGPATEQAVANFNKFFGIPGGGVCGRDTWGMLSF